MMLATDRLKIEKKLMQLEAQSGVESAGPVSSDNLFDWSVILSGPPNSSWEDGKFKLKLKFPEDYPYDPPTAMFETEVFHPNVSAYGNVCISILHLENWRPNIHVSEILSGILYLLSNPNAGDCYNLEAGELYRNNRLMYAQRVKACARKSNPSASSSSSSYFSSSSHTRFSVSLPSPNSNVSLAARIMEDKVGAIKTKYGDSVIAYELKGDFTIVTTNISPRYGFPDYGTIYMNTPIPSGVSRWSVLIHYGDGVSSISIGIIPPDVLGKEWDPSSPKDGSCFLKLNQEVGNKYFTQLIGTKDSSDLGCSVSNNSLVALEVDTQAQTLKFFVEEELIPHGVRMISPGFHFGVRGSFGTSFTPIVFGLLSSSMSTPSNFRFHQYGIA